MKDGKTGPLVSHWQEMANTSHLTGCRFQNITSQPLFGNGTVPGICDDYVEIGNTTLTTGFNAPVPVVGNVTVRAPFFRKTRAWSQVFGFRYDVAWVDRPGVPCTSLAG